jgi:hypothetical protein
MNSKRTFVTSTEKKKDYLTQATLMISAAYNNTQSVLISSGLKKPTTYQVPAASRRKCVS